MKIAILGYSGSGKSTLAKYLGHRYGIPVLYLDRVQFLPGWQVRDRGEAVSIVEEFMKQPSWVIDGNYSNFLQEKRLLHKPIQLFLVFQYNRLFPVPLYDAAVAAAFPFRAPLVKNPADKRPVHFLQAAVRHAFARNITILQIPPAGAKEAGEAGKIHEDDEIRLF